MNEKLLKLGSATVFVTNLVVAISRQLYIVVTRYFSFLIAQHSILQTSVQFLENHARTWCLIFLFNQSIIQIIVGFTLQAKLVSSKHVIQVHLKIASRSLETLASHLVTKFTLEAQAVNHLSR